VRQRLGQQKVVLVGQSWGTLIGAEVAHRRPELLYAFVAFGQLTGWESSYEGIRQRLLELARTTHDQALEARMTAVGPIPVGPDPAPFLAAMDPVWDEMNRRGYSWHSKTGSPAPLDDLFLAATVMSPSVSDRRLWQLLTGANNNDHYRYIHPTVSGWSLERDVGTEFRVPYILIMGRYDWQTPVNLAREYFAKVCAPYKVYVELPNSAHVALLEEPGRALLALVETVLPATQGKVPANAETCTSAAH
jgi:pimeloyl-ACP methyl ester carboxylesterase